MRLAVERPARFGGVASFIASLPEDEIMDASGPTPIFLLAGDADPLVLIEGGPVAGDRAPTRSVADTVAYWIRINGADPVAESETLLPDNAPDDGCRITETVYVDASDRSPSVIYYEAVGGGHSIPDPDAPARSPAADALLGPQCRDVNGVDLAFDFLSQL
jgi:poly(3-hydroxybutyrate) depolymerase